MCAGRFVDAQDDLDGTPRGVAVDEWSAILAYRPDHIRDLQGVRPVGEIRRILCGRASTTGLLARLWSSPVSAGLFGIIASQVKIVQVIVLDHCRSPIAKNLDAGSDARIGASGRSTG